MFKNVILNIQFLWRNIRGLKLPIP